MFQPFISFSSSAEISHGEETPIFHPRELFIALSASPTPRLPPPHTLGYLGRLIAYLCLLLTGASTVSTDCRHQHPQPSASTANNSSTPVTGVCLDKEL
ncbi:hypothetical protein E3N88_07347 [Mikania micrantha]|uniref:Uncharacterized protein n=1 Tax=Mikania micrantha TaxID=192012 RepID=A0A5N6PS01_9ASTR|nr:hypothetical protein E3N88_07347 [Mikania micrantha]